jgi:glycosyltransferase involved in cell wall biosynthesis
MLSSALLSELQFPPVRVGVPIPKGSPSDGGGFEFQDIIFSEICRRISSAAIHNTIQFIPITHSPHLAYHWNLNSDQLLSLQPSRSLKARSSLHAIAKQALQPWRNLPFYSTLSGRHELLKLQREVDIIWHLSDRILTDQVPYIITIWDLQHRLQPIFPEVTRGGAWEEREAYLQKAVIKSSLVVTGTNRGAMEAQSFYQVDPSRLLINPFPCPPRATFTDLEQHGFLLSKNLLRHKFLLYPAQFWPHKNHLSALIALQQLLDQGHDFKLVLTGTDKGALQSIMSLLNQLSLGDRVVYCGFVSRKALAILYSSAFALLFPSFFGPDNIPPLEAMSYRTPALVADVPGSHEQFGEAALRFDPSNPIEIVELVNMLIRSETLRQTLADNGELLISTLTASNYVDIVTSWICKSSIQLHCGRLWSLLK